MAVDRFHAHLDQCAQCCEHPMALCATGAQLLRAAAFNEDAVTLATESDRDAANQILIAVNHVLAPRGLSIVRSTVDRVDMYHVIDIPKVIQP